MTDKKIGIALSGGGALGASHAGVLKALDEMGIKPHHITGVSAGAVVGSLKIGEALRCMTGKLFCKHNKFKDCSFYS